METDDISTISFIETDNIINMENPVPEFWDSLIVGGLDTTR